MSPMVNSSNFKNNVNKPGKRKVHPVVPLLFVMILASLLILISSFVADVNSGIITALPAGQKEMQSIYDEQNSTQEQK